MSIGQVDWKDSRTSLSHGGPLDRWTGQDSGTSLVCEGGMSNGRPMDVHWIGGLEGQWDKPGP